IAELRADEHVAEAVAVHVAGQRDGIAVQILARPSRELGICNGGRDESGERTMEDVGLAAQAGRELRRTDEQIVDAVAVHVAAARDRAAELVVERLPLEYHVGLVRAVYAGDRA